MRIGWDGAAGCYWLRFNRKSIRAVTEEDVCEALRHYYHRDCSQDQKRCPLCRDMGERRASR